MSTSSPVRSLGSSQIFTFPQKICCFIDILKHPPLELAKKRLLAAVPLFGSLKKKKNKINELIKKRKNGVGGAILQVVVVSVKLRILNFRGTVG